jgi:hypothetical protein
MMDSTSQDFNFDMYDRDFRNDFDQNFRRAGYGYQRFRSAYRYGYNLAAHRPYQGQTWKEIEIDARRDWEMQHPAEPWKDFKGAVQHAYQRVRTDMKD